MKHYTVTSFTPPKSSSLLLRLLLW